MILQGWIQCEFAFMFGRWISQKLAEKVLPKVDLYPNEILLKFGGDPDQDLDPIIL